MWHVKCVTGFQLIIAIKQEILEQYFVFEQLYGIGPRSCYASKFKLKEAIR